MNKQAPKYGIPFRIENYTKNPVLEKQQSNSGEHEEKLIPIKTPRRRQINTKIENTQTSELEIIPPINKLTNMEKHDELISNINNTFKEQSFNNNSHGNVVLSKRINDTKLTACEISELVMRRLPANELFEIVNSDNKQPSKTIDKCDQCKTAVIIQQPTFINSKEAINTNFNDKNDENKEQKKENPCSENWQFVKCACCFICGCSACTTILSTCIVLYYEYLG